MPKKYSRRGSRKRTYRRRRTYKPRPNPMMSSRNAYTNQVWTQSFVLTQFGVTPSAYAYFAVDCLGETAATNTKIFQMADVQSSAQTIFNAAMTEFTIRSVSVKLIFPDNVGGNQPVAWCMGYDDVEFLDQPQISSAPTSLQALQGTQTGPIPTNRTISRTFNMAGPKAKLGLSWSAVNDFTYYDQLGAKRPYIMCWVQNVGNYNPSATVGTVVQITYHASYKQTV